MVDTKDDTRGGFRRVEVLVGERRRRDWSADDKGRIVAESFAPGSNISDVARRHGLRPQQLFAWRHEAKKGALVLPGDGPLPFVPIMVAAESVPEAPPREPTRRDESAPANAVEVIIGVATVRASPGTDIEFLTDVLRAVRASA